MLGQVAQLVEQRTDNVDPQGAALRRRLTCDQQVKRAQARGRSQNPCAKMDQSYKGQVAQLVEQRTENPCVGGSIPPLATRFLRCPDLTQTSVGGPQGVDDHRLER